jgi:hypothetical protein
MKFINIKTQLALFAVTAMLVASCKKVEVPQPVGTAGRTWVKIIGGGSPASPGVVKSPIDFKPTPITLTAADLRRDCPNATELARTMHVTVKDDTAAVRIANAAYKILPAAWYTIGSTTPKTGGLGGTFNVTFNAGEFAKPILITIPDATVLDPSTLYGLGFTITTTDADGNISSVKTEVIEIGAKNAYDGIYSYVSGLVTRYTAPGVPAGDALSGPLGSANPDVTMSTVGAYTVEVTGHTWSGGTSGIGGIDNFRVTVDPNTNLVNCIALGNATLTNWAGHTNSYDPVKKTFTLAFRWNPTANVREYEVVYKYKGPR